MSAARKPASPPKAAARPRKGREPKDWPMPTVGPPPKLLAIPLDAIEPDPAQPRKEFDGEELVRLAGSLVEYGQRVPAIVRAVEGSRGRYVLIDGERRWRAARQAGLPTLICLVAEREDPTRTLLVQLTTGLQRADLSPLEKARAYKEVIQATGLSARALAEVLNVDHKLVSRHLALLDLPAEVRDLIDKGQLGYSLAEPIGRLDEWDAIDVATLAVAAGWSRARVEAEVAARLAPAPQPALAPPPANSPEPSHRGTPAESPRLSHGGTPAVPPEPAETTSSVAPTEREEPRPGAGPHTEATPLLGGGPDATPGPPAGLMDVTPADAPGTREPGARNPEPGTDGPGHERVLIYDRPAPLATPENPARLHVTLDVERAGDWAGTVYVSLSSTTRRHGDWPPGILVEVLEMTLTEARQS